MMLTLLLPPASAAATAAVTDASDCVTPSATTPLSAQKTSTRFFAAWGTGVRWTAAIRAVRVSSRPRECSGLATASQRRRHSL